MPALIRRDARLSQSSAPRATTRRQGSTEDEMDDYDVDCGRVVCWRRKRWRQVGAGESRAVRVQLSSGCLRLLLSGATAATTTQNAERASCKSPTWTLSSSAAQRSAAQCSQVIP